MGKAALASVFTRLWHSTAALPGCGASLLHQQIASIPFLRELPRAPRRGDTTMAPHQRCLGPGRVLFPCHTELPRETMEGLHRLLRSPRPFSGQHLVSQERVRE